MAASEGMYLPCLLLFEQEEKNTIAVAAIITVGTMVAGAIVAPVQGPFEPFVALELAVYSVGVHSRLRPGLATLVAVNVFGVLSWLVVTLHVDGTAYGDWIPALVSSSSCSSSLRCCQGCTAASSPTSARRPRASAS